MIQLYFRRQFIIRIMKVLIVEDEHRIASALKKGLEQERFLVDIEYDGEAGLDMAMSEEYDAIVLDLMLPKMDGVTVCKKIRAEGIHTPIIMLTAKGQISEKVEGLDSGADDYLVKPFAFAELIARMRAVVRRPEAIADNAVKIGDIVLDNKNFSVTRSGSPVSLTRKEFTLLAYLIHNTGHVITKENIIRHVWDYDADVLDNTVEVYIRTLRRKLGPPDPIATVRGFGYMIKAAK
jgi:DNA-binding response OmpR family regulator